jgi:hypothetical protein
VPASASSLSWVTSPTTFEASSLIATSATIALFVHEQVNCKFPETPIVNPSESSLTWLSRSGLSLTIAQPGDTFKSQSLSFTYSGSVAPTSGTITSATTAFTITILQRACMPVTASGAAVDGKGVYDNTAITIPKYGTSAPGADLAADGSTVVLTI